MIKEMQAIIGTGEPTREALVAAERVMTEFGDPTFFPLAHFPLKETTGEASYRLWEETDHSYALYLFVDQGDVRTPPHNHQTWAVNTTLIGEEINTLYQVRYHPREPGENPVQVQGRKVLAPGVAISLMPRDIHAIETVADETSGVVMSLHLYGYAIDRPIDRQMFDMVSGRAESYPAWDDIIDPPMGA
jgi:predicted metal-dependent enzyme (double-stranded beta helix superfamily)